MHVWSTLFLATGSTSLAAKLLLNLTASVFISAAMALTLVVSSTTAWCLSGWSRVANCHTKNRRR